MADPILNPGAFALQQKNANPTHTLTEIPDNHVRALVTDKSTGRPSTITFPVKRLKDKEKEYAGRFFKVVYMPVPTRNKENKPGQ